MILPAPQVLLPTTLALGLRETKNIPRKIGGATNPAYFRTFQYPQRTCVQLADPTV